MNDLTLVFLIVLAALLVGMAAVTAPYRSQIVPNYRAMFLFGLLLIPTALNTNLGVMGIGVILSGVGWRNRDKWGKHTKWADFPPALKKLKLFFVGALGALAVSFGIYLFISRGQ